MVTTSRGMKERLVSALDLQTQQDPNAEDSVSFIRDVDGPAFVVVLNSGETFRIDVRHKKGR